MEAVNKWKFVGRLSLAVKWLLQRAIAIVPERLFFSKTNDCHPPNDYFSQKRAIVNSRRSVFLKNERLSPPERVAATM